MKTAVITAQGIGDGLLMMITSYHLQKLGHQVTTFNPHLKGFGGWFKDFDFTYPFQIQDLLHFDNVILQHDNTALAKEVVRKLQEKQKPNLYIFYTNYKVEKHGAIDPYCMFVFNRKKTMLQNIMLGTKTLFSLQEISKYNGIQPLPGLVHRKNKKDIVIHPSSGALKRSWPSYKFIKLAKTLQKKGYRIIFTLAPNERENWKFVQNSGFSLPEIKNLSDLANIIYESAGLIGNDSGPAHLASCLNIPAIVLGRGKNHLVFWKPDWHKTVIIRPSGWIPNFKFLRIREKYWKKWVRAKKVVAKFQQLIKK